MKYFLKTKKLYFVAIFFLVFLLDRLSKFYILNLAESGDVDIYINTYINFYLIWNKGVAFGLLSSDENYLYSIVTALIIIINLIIIYFIFITKDFRAYFFLIILGVISEVLEGLYGLYTLAAIIPNLSISVRASSRIALPFNVTPPGSCTPSNLLKFIPHCSLISAVA